MIYKCRLIIKQDGKFGNVIKQIETRCGCDNQDYTRVLLCGDDHNVLVYTRKQHFTNLESDTQRNIRGDAVYSQTTNF